jgi:hypothetical protein
MAELRTISIQLTIFALPSSGSRVTPTYHHHLRADSMIKRVAGFPGVYAHL